MTAKAGTSADNEAPGAAADGAGSQNKQATGNGSFDALSVQVRTWIDNNPERSFSSILEADLTRRGGSRELYAHCPFHVDRKASFRVNLEKGSWYCDPCGRGGDAISLSKELWAVDFKEALTRLAAMFGILGSNGYARGAHSSTSTEEPEQEARERKEVRRIRHPANSSCCA